MAQDRQRYDACVDAEEKACLREAGLKYGRDLLGQMDYNARLRQADRDEVLSRINNNYGIL